MGSESRPEVPGRFVLERRCTSCAPLGVPVAGSGSETAAAREAKRRADDDGHVYWIRDRWAPRGPDGRNFSADRGRVVRMIFPEESAGAESRLEGLA